MGDFFFLELNNKSFILCLKIIYTVLFLVGISFNAQSKDGINFQTKNLEEAKNWLNKKNKLIFIDFTLHGVDKLMKKNTFPDAELGAFFNKILSAFTLMPKRRCRSCQKIQNCKLSLFSFLR